jgi:hypothetical protein
MVTVDHVCELARRLPRSYDVVVRGRLKFRVGRIVYLAFSKDETVMGFAFPKEWRNVLLESEPHKFLPPERVDVRYNWLQVRLSAIDEAEMRDLVIDAWRFVVPKRVAASHQRQMVRGGSASSCQPEEERRGYLSAEPRSLASSG